MVQSAECQDCGLYSRGTLVRFPAVAKLSKNFQGPQSLLGNGY